MAAQMHRIKDETSSQGTAGGKAVLPDELYTRARFRLEK